jgi:hypothetical protein
MGDPIMLLSASWKISGIVSERRELTSDKNKSWRGYVVKVASLGTTFEVQVDKRQYEELTPGQLLQLDGHFEDQGGRQKLVVDRYSELKDGGAK